MRLLEPCLAAGSTWVVTEASGALGPKIWARFIGLEMCPGHE